MPDEEWLSALYQKHYQMLYAIGRLFVGQSHAHNAIIEDKIQEIFLLLWRKRHKLFSHPNIDGWLVETMRRTMLNHVKTDIRHAKHFNFSLDEYEYAEPVIESIFPSPEESLSRRETLATLKDLLGDENTALLYGYYAEKRTARELAGTLNLSESCIRMRILRLKKLILENKSLFLSIMCLLFVMKP